MNSDYIKPGSEPFHFDSPGCWCPDSRTVQQLRLMGHTEECSAARKAWRQNHREDSEIARRKHEAEALGEAMLRSARAALAEVPT